MADPVTMSDVAALAKDHSDIRREAAEHTNEIVREGMRGDYTTTNTIRDAATTTNNLIETSTDRLGAGLAMHDSKVGDRFFAVARDTADLRAQVVQVLSEAKLIGAAVAKDTEISVLKNTIESQKNTQYLSDKIGADGDKTRALINELKYNDLNRDLIERNALIVEERGYGRWARHGWDQSQFATVNSQLQAFQSQLQETRQGVTNFGTMSGNAGRQQATNNVA